MDERDRVLLHKLQKEFPLSPRPFLALGQALGVPETEVLGRLAELRAEGLIRQISAIFDARSLGYHSSLVAAKVGEGILEEAAAVVSAHPGVSHNYQRGHDYNLWFTLAVPPEGDLAREASSLLHRAGAASWMLLPSLRTFKIEAVLDPGGDPLARGEAPRHGHSPAPLWLSEQDKRAVRALQEDLPASPRPFLPLAEGLGWSEEELFDWMAEAGRLGVMRRFAAILRHRTAGFSSNGMGVWKAPPERVEELGRLFAGFKAVTHCYQRPSGPDWPYNLFTMVHARSGEEGREIFAALSRAAGLGDYLVLDSVREFKKARVKFFQHDADHPWPGGGDRKMRAT